MSDINEVSLESQSSPDLNPLDYTIWDVLENKRNATSHPNICSLKAGEGMKYNVWRIYFEGMQIVSKAFWYNNWKKNDGHIE